MKTFAFASLLVVAAVTGPTPARAQTDPADAYPRNRFGLSYRMGFNMSAQFENLGRLPMAPILVPSATPGRMDRVYEDGYVRVDSTGNLPLPGTTVGGDTTYWGYRHPEQVTAGNQSVLMHRSWSDAGVTSPDVTDNPQHGLELSYQRTLGKSGPAFWGVEAAFGYTALGLRDQNPLSGTITRQTDAFNLGGLSAPSAPYDGPFAGGPGSAFLGDTPLSSTWTTIPGGSTITGYRRFDADLYGGRLGPFVRLPISDRFAVTMSGGLAIVGVNSDFRFQETVSVMGASPFQRADAGTDSDVLVGGFFSGSLAYRMTRATDVFAGFQYQNLGDYTQLVGGRNAVVNLGDSIFVTLGLGYSF